LPQSALTTTRKQDVLTTQLRRSNVAVVPIMLPLDFELVAQQQAYLLYH